MAKTIDYEFKRGDSYQLNKFRIMDMEKNLIELTEAEQLYFTVKTDSNNSNVLIQKKINSGIELGDDGYYHIMMEPSDTNNLDYGTYVYDIELKSINPKIYVKTIIDGTITLTDEVTWKENE